MTGPAYRERIVRAAFQYAEAQAVEADPAIAEIQRQCVERCARDLLDDLTGWTAVLTELARIQRCKVSADDRGMVSASMEDLILWVDDLEARIGLNVDGLRYAMHAYLDARGDALPDAGGHAPGCNDDDCASCGGAA